MKKALCFILITILTLFTFTVYADSIDLSGMSFDDLKALQEQVNTALWASDGWKEVTVPVGVYVVGSEIPAGKWTIKRAFPNEYSYFRVGQRFENGEVCDYSFTSDLESEINVILVEGSYIEITYFPVVFTKYVPSFSFE